MKHRRKTIFRRRVRRYMRMGIWILILLLVALAAMRLFQLGPFNRTYIERTGSDIDAHKPEIDVQLLTINRYSRPGKKSGRIKDIVIHYTANPGSTAMQNRNYFEGLKDSRATSASSHFVVGLEGEIVQCVPTWEIAYASNDRNEDSLSIETCHLTEDGSYTDATYQSLVELTAWLCKKFELTEDNVIRHYDITEKNCPKYFVENQEAWELFKEQVGAALEQM